MPIDLNGASHLVFRLLQLRTIYVNVPVRDSAIL